MFVILGSPRSGTTLLSSTLDLNDNLTLPDETDFIIPTAFVINRVKEENVGKKLISELMYNSERFNSSIGKYLLEEEVNDIVMSSDYSTYGIISNIYRNIAIKTGAKLAGDKSPNDLLYLRILVETGFFNSNIKVIHIVRDIRDVILSLKKVKWDVDWKSNVEDFFPRMWSDTNLYLYNLLKSEKNKYFFIRYEDMINDPENSFKRITDFLGVPFQEKMLDQTARGLEQRKLDHHKNLSKPFLSDKVAEWRKQLDPQIVELCEKQAKECLTEFRYPHNKDKFNLKRFFLK